MRRPCKQHHGHDRHGRAAEHDSAQFLHLFHTADEQRAEDGADATGRKQVAESGFAGTEHVGEYRHDLRDPSRKEHPDEGQCHQPTEQRCRPDETQPLMYLLKG